MLFKWICQWIWFVCALWTFPCLQVSSSSSCRRSSSLQVCFSYFRKFLLSVLCVMFFFAFCLYSTNFHSPSAFTFSPTITVERGTWKKNLSRKITYQNFVFACMWVLCWSDGSSEEEKGEKQALDKPRAPAPFALTFWHGRYISSQPLTGK